MASYPDQTDPGLFLSTTQVWSISELQSVDVTKPEFKDLLAKLYWHLGDMSDALNLKDTGKYALTEFVNGQTFFPDPTLNSTTARTPIERQVFRKVINFGALLNTATKTVAHGINILNNFTFTRIYGTASDLVGLNYIPLPCASAATSIELRVDGTNVYITTTSDRTAFTNCYVILEYIKS